MAPNIPEVVKELKERLIRSGIKPFLEDDTKNDTFWKAIDPRGIPPMVIEDTIATAKPIAGTGKYTGTWHYINNGIKVVLNSKGDVVTIHPV